MKKAKKVILTGMFLSAFTLTGCVKPYNKPVFVEIEPNQTAFVIPLEGNTGDQGKFESEALLKESQVATKRVQVERKWVQTGAWWKLWWSGEYKDTVKVIVVDRYPETREWKDENAFIGESKDSIKFEQGMSATAQILEEDTATFLYQYSGKTLAEVMDKEVRNKIGTVLLEEYGAISIDEIRGDKADVIAKVRAEVEPYFKERGITLSNIGYIGDLKYLQSDIQEAINKDFKAQQEQKAQETMNETEIEKAEAEAEANRIRKESMEEIVEIKKLELQERFIEKWDGKMPIYNGSGDDSLLMQMPTPENEEDKKEE
ncbi:SPFH domain-containing protein [Shouchella clausii]|uniref:SPFH domain-containing protein n=1 Tax=Shouchella clausii TaxID=79880 RepID=UPI002DBA7C99|nr:SPFH domain-containing protein [Shouchella clausii]MEB5480755.1 SPFH domain-containing protein [Shouchella clausii]